MENYNKRLKYRSRDLRTKSTLGEVLLWNEIKSSKLGVIFYRQKPLENYIVDFYCRKLKLVIEIDGSSHNNRIEEDAFRQRELESIGISFLRFTETDVRNNINSVLQVIKEKINHPI